MRHLLPSLILALSLLPACKSDSSSASTTPQDDGPAWVPGVRYQTARDVGARGFLDRRGLIHAHSIYSHDACDYSPQDDAGVYNQGCLTAFREGLCAQKMDFVMVTDHNTSFSMNEFPDVLLYRESEGDKLIERGGAPVANRMHCADTDPVTVLAGTESKSLQVGFERHVGATPEERQENYGKFTPEVLQAFNDAGAVNLLMHTEEWSIEELMSEHVQGFEMFNLHANAIVGAGPLVGLIATATRDNTDPSLPHPDLILAPVISEDPIYLTKWGTVLSRGAKRVTTMGTDCHNNTFKTLLADGERIDSYRRMMGWFSNHLLVRPAEDGSWDDTSLKEALTAGRLYGAIEMFGVPEGFDYHAVVGDKVHEMGETVAAGATLNITAPHVAHLDPKLEAPVIIARLLKAREDGWDEVATSQTNLSFTVKEPGAYRAEIRIVPNHLKPSLGDYAEQLTAPGGVFWVYSNAIYVTP